MYSRMYRQTHDTHTHNFACNHNFACLQSRNTHAHARSAAWARGRVEGWAGGYIQGHGVTASPTDGPTDRTPRARDPTH